MAHI
ncbi:e4e3b334-7d8f-45f8-982d-ce09e268e4a3 [Thermothielavioides terrestris]|jgi:NAD(P)-dependent dehydrogenase (short-subunit alcohol dehydrogenase family)